LVTDAATGASFDALLTGLLLEPGTYTVSLVQYSNSPLGTNVSDGFGFPGYVPIGFVDISGDVRTSAWALDILNVEGAGIVSPQAGVPDTGSAIGLLFISLGAVLVVDRRFRTR
jgi:hypothetical protein